MSYSPEKMRRLVQEKAQKYMQACFVCEQESKCYCVLLGPKSGNVALGIALQFEEVGSAVVTLPYEVEGEENQFVVRVGACEKHLDNLCLLVYSVQTTETLTSRSVQAAKEGMRPLPPLTIVFVD